MYYHNCNDYDYSIVLCMPKAFAFKSFMFPRMNYNNKNAVIIAPYRDFFWTKMPLSVLHLETSKSTNAVYDFFNNEFTDNK